MSDTEYILEQKLRTTGLVVLLSVVWFFIIAITTVFDSALSTASPSLVYVVDGIFTVMIATAMFFFSSVKAAVRRDPDGPSLVVAYGPGGRVKQVFYRYDIVSGVAGNYSFMQMGGYGYRGSLKILRRAALATRSGEALDLLLTRKRRFIVTVDDPQAFLTALELNRS